MINLFWAPAPALLGLSCLLIPAAPISIYELGIFEIVLGGLLMWGVIKERS